MLLAFVASGLLLLRSNEEEVRKDLMIKLLQMARRRALKKWQGFELLKDTQHR